MGAVCCSSVLSHWSLSAAGTQAKVSSMVSMGKKGIAQKSFFVSWKLNSLSSISVKFQPVWNRIFDVNFDFSLLKLFLILIGKRCTRLSKSDIRVQIVHSDHNTTRGNDDEEDVKEPMVNIYYIHQIQINSNVVLSSFSCSCLSKVLFIPVIQKYGFPSGSKQQRVSWDITHRT